MMFRNLSNETTVFYNRFLGTRRNSQCRINYRSLPSHASLSTAISRFRPAPPCLPHRISHCSLDETVDLSLSLTLSLSRANPYSQYPVDGFLVIDLLLSPFPRYFLFSFFAPLCDIMDFSSLGVRDDNQSCEFLSRVLILSGNMCVKYV